MSATFTVTAERGTRRWVLQCVEHPGALSEVTRLADASDAIREAIAFVADIPQDSFDVHIVPQLPDGVLDRLEHARVMRHQAEELSATAAAEIRAAAHELTDAGLSMRDAGDILGVSFQRVHQLLEEPIVEAPAAAVPVLRPTEEAWSP